MHPVLAQFLSFEAARQALGKARARAGLAPEEALLAAAAEADPALRDRVEAEPHPKRPSEPAQAALLQLAADAALRALEADEALRPWLEPARRSLEAQGRSPAEAREALRALVSEEAFAWEDDALGFDADFFTESLERLARLAQVSPTQVSAFESGFVEKSVDRRGAAGALESLLRPAWAEGPRLLHPGDLRAALPSQKSPTERAALAALLEALERAGLLGARRCGRLLAMIPSGAATPR